MFTIIYDKATIVIKTGYKVLYKTQIDYYYAL